MDVIKLRRNQFLVIFITAAVFFCENTVAANKNLRFFESKALQYSSELRSLSNQQKAKQEQAVAAGQWKDPKLMFGAMNVPVDSFNFSQEPMTQIQAGLSQQFPKGKSLYYRSLSTEKNAKATGYQTGLIKLVVLKNVRLAWVNLYLWQQSRWLVLAQKKVFQHLLKVTESLLSHNKAQQKDVIRAQLELNTLDDKLISIDQHERVAKAVLARWVGNKFSNHKLPKKLPRWNKPPSLTNLYAGIRKHPLIRRDQELIQSDSSSVHYAQQQFKPGVTAGVMYGYRQGRNMNDTQRSDFISANLSIDLPIFTKNRQSRLLKASEKKLASTQENELTDYRTLIEAAKTVYANWRAATKSSWLYRKHLVPEAILYAKSTRIAYQNTETDFPTLARAYVRELDTKLKALKTNVSVANARIDMLYLQGK